MNKNTVDSVVREIFPDEFELPTAARKNPLHGATTLEVVAAVDRGLEDALTPEARINTWIEDVVRGCEPPSGPA